VGRRGVGRPGLHEEAVGVAVEHAGAARLDPGLAPQQQLAAEAGDGVGEARVEEAAGGRAEDPVERVHQDLDGLAGDGVARAPGRLAPRQDLVEDPAEDALLPPEDGAVRGLDRVLLELAGLGSDEVERVDLERADEARVQAAEVEHGDVRVQAGQRLEHVAAGLRLHLAHGADARGHDPAPAERAEVEEVEGGDRGGDAVERQPGQPAALDGELHEPQLLEDLEREPRVGAVVLDEAHPVLPEEAQDLLRLPGAFDRLAFAEHLARDRVEALLLQADEGAAQQLHAVEHDAAGHARLQRAARGLERAQPQRPRAAPQLERDAASRRDPRQHGQVEVDHVPAGEHVGVQLPHARREPGEQRGLAREGPGVAGAGPALGRQQQHLGDAAAVQRHREQPVRRRVGLDVERQHGQPRRPVAGAQLRLVEDDAEARDLEPVALDRDRAADPALDQVAHREADVGLEGGDAGGLEALAQRRHLGRRLDVDAGDGPTGERAPVAGRGRARAEPRPRPLEVRRLEAEVRPRPAVAHEERPAVLQPAVEVHDRSAGRDAVRRLEDETAEAGHSGEARPAGRTAQSTPRPPPRFVSAFAFC
jgi:hypothetical protein